VRPHLNFGGRFGPVPFALVAFLVFSLLALRADESKAAVTITRPAPLETLSADGSVSSVAQAKVGSTFVLVATNGDQLTLKDSSGAQYRISAAATDHHVSAAASAPPVARSAPMPDRDSSFNLGWHFVREEDLGFAPPKMTGTTSNLGTDDLAAPTVTVPSFDDSKWDKVNLPHTPRIEKFAEHLPWQGLCWYRKTFAPEPAWAGRRVSLEFQGAMQVADVWVNGEHRMTHYGGFLPFTLDLSDDVAAGKPITLAVCLDNRDNGFVPPGKPLQGADFEYYGGLYRDVILHVTDPLHITDAVAANHVAGGGVFVTFPKADPSAATVHVLTDVQNDGNAQKEPFVVCTLTDANGRVVASGHSDPVATAQGADSEIAQDIHVPSPQLWSPEQPYLYQLHVQVQNGIQITDEESFPIGIRRFEFDLKKGFSINGRHLFLHGANRHQYYPWIGDALSDNEQYRDLQRLKTEGWNCVRLCHYPQSAQVMDACDRLGLVALVCSPGWQYYSKDAAFVSRVEQADRDMVRWHRNHASAMFWEVTLNEEYAPLDKVQQWAAAIREELPGGQCFLAGDTKDYGDPKDIGFDVPYPGWNNPEVYSPTQDTSRVRFVREYGAQAESDPIYGDGNMMTQVRVAEQSFSDIARQPWYSGCARWSYMDYLRGSFAPIYNSGAVTIDRIPKFLYYFHKSQFPPQLHTPLYESGPMVYIANYWKSNSPRDVSIFSNCEQVELSLNGVSLGKQGPDTDDNSKAVAHPIFTFKNVNYSPGTLVANGYVDGQVAATCTVKTPSDAKSLKLVAEELSRPLTADGSDFIFVRAEVVDENGTLVPDAKVPITFSTEGDGAVVGDNPRTSSVGVTSILLQAGLTPGDITVSATADGLAGDTLVLHSVPPNPALRAWR
jgi:beta-galactosidase